MKLNYTESGKGNKTLVFQHYFGGAASTWDTVISLLQNEFHCIAIDLLGFGKSSAPITEISVDDSADAVIGLLQDLSLSNYILIGHSMGGKIALDIASRKMKGLQSLILFAPSPPTAEPMTDKERQAMSDAFGKKDSLEKMINNVTAQPLAPAAFEKEVANNLAVSDIGWHSWPQLGSKEDISSKMQDVHVPITIVFGGKDKKFTKTFLQKEFSQYFKTFTLIEIPESGHLLPVEAPDEVAGLIKTSLA